MRRVPAPTVAVISIAALFGCGIGAPGAGVCPPETDDELPTTTVTPVVADDHVRFEDLQNIGNAVVIEQVGGLTVDEATAWGRERGWTDVYEIDLAAQSGDRAYSTDLDPTRFRVLHCDGTVVSAVVG